MARGRETPSGRAHSFGFWLAAIAAAGLVLRFVVIVAFDGRPLADDGFSYLVGARDLVEGDGFINPLDGTQDARNPPGWKVVLAVPIVLGIDQPLAIQIYAGLLGVATVVAVGFLGRRIVDPSVGLVAATIAAGYPGFWTYERELHSETLVLLGVAVLLMLAYRFRQRPSLGGATALGAALALLALVRAETLVLALILAAPLILSTAKPWRQRIGWLAASAAASVLVLLPWTAHNLERFQEPVLLSSGLGAAMAQGNCDATYYGEAFGTYRFGCLLSAVGPLAREKKLDSSEVDIAARQAALDYAQDNIGRVPAVLAARQARTWGLMAPAQQIRFDSESSNTPEWVGWSAMVSYWVLASFAIGGAVILRRQDLPIWPMLAIVCSVVLATSLTFGQTRYRASAEVPIILLAATSIVTLWSRWRAPPSTSPTVSAHTWATARGPVKEG